MRPKSASINIIKPSGGTTTSMMTAKTIPYDELLPRNPQLIENTQNLTPLNLVRYPMLTLNRQDKLKQY